MTLQHTLIVHEGHDADNPDWEIVHPAECPQEQRGAVIDKEFAYLCNVQFCVDHQGIEDIDGWEKLAPGSYPIRFHGHWSGSMFDDAEAYIYIPTTGAEQP